AEAGIEDALQKIRSNQAIDPSVVINADDPDPNKHIQVKVNAQDLGGGQTYISDTQLDSGDHFFLNMRSYAGDTMEICWASPNSAAIQVMFYYQDLSTVGAGQDSYFINPGIARFRYEPPAPDTLVEDQSCSVGGYTDSTGVLDLGIATGGKTPDFIAVWVWYGSVSGMAFIGDQNIPIQGKNVTATAYVTEQGTNVTRRITYFVSSRNYPPAWLFMGLATGSFNFGLGRTW
ncbi:hypothetical protein COU89_03645, partial [Candidatus Roizmanbacteria bacterium CG10_big_fil_rev_8_21_14_0_10_45_7]